MPIYLSPPIIPYMYYICIFKKEDEDLDCITNVKKKSKSSSQMQTLSEQWRWANLTSTYTQTWNNIKIFVPYGNRTGDT